MRRTPALVSSVATVAVLSAVLVGCSASPDDANACTPLIAAGDTSELVTATGEPGSMPTVDVPAPLVAKTPERSVLGTGTGLVAHEGMTVDYDLLLVDGETGAPVQQSPFDGTANLRRAGGDGALAQSLVCAQAGQRIVLTTTLGDSGGASAGVSEEVLAHSFVIVLEVHGVYLGQANGLNQVPPDGLPVVVTAPDGTVGITIPSGIAIPAADRTADIKIGSGTKLAEGDAAVVQVGTWTWPADGTAARQKSSTWDSNPELLTVTGEGQQALPGAILEALVGTPIGSQVLIVAAPTSEGGDATVYVIDVLGIRPPSDAK